MFTAVLIAILVFAAYMGAVSLLGKRQTVSSQMRRMGVLESNSPLGQDVAWKGLDVTPSPMAELFEATLQMMGVDIAKHLEALQMRMARAGISSPHAAIYYLFLKRVGFAIFIIAGLVFIYTDESEGFMKFATIMLGLGIMLGGYWGGDIYLKNRTQKRQKVLERSFPDVLDLILVCVESGLALDAALSRVAKELDTAHPEITKELNRTRMERTLLADRSQALINLAERTDMVAFRTLVASLLQSERFGTSLTETLKVLSEDYRHTRLMRAENWAGKLPALMAIPLMLLMMPAFVMILVGPAIIAAFAAFNR